CVRGPGTRDMLSRSLVAACWLGWAALMRLPAFLAARGWGRALAAIAAAAASVAGPRAGARLMINSPDDSTHGDSTGTLGKRQARESRGTQRVRASGGPDRPGPPNARGRCGPVSGRLAPAMSQSR